MKDIKYDLIIFIKGPVETLSYFSEQIGNAISDGYNIPVFYWNMTEPLSSREQLYRECTEDKRCLLITFNFIGLSGEGQFMTTNAYGEEFSIWDNLNIRKLSYLVDHPLYYYNQLAELNGNCDIACVDREHVEYIKRYYPLYGSVFFVPLGGTCLNIQDNIKKDIDILFTGNYVRMDMLEDKINSLDEDNREFCYRIIDDLKANPGRSIDEVILTNARMDIPDISEADILLITHKLMVIDLYIRSYFRRKIVCSLAERGYRITVIGKDWEYADCKCTNNLVMYGQGDSYDCLKFMARAKLSLNVMPWFKNGAHDRIFNAMAQHSVSVTDTSVFLEKQFTDNKNVVFYSLDKLDNLQYIIDNALNNWERISDCGYEEVMNNHLWKHRTDLIIKYIMGDDTR